MLLYSLICTKLIPVVFTNLSFLSHQSQCMKTMQFLSGLFSHCPIVLYVTPMSLFNQSINNEGLLVSPSQLSQFSCLSVLAMSLYLSDICSCAALIFCQLSCHSAFLSVVVVVLTLLCSQQLKPRTGSYNTQILFYKVYICFSTERKSNLSTNVVFMKSQKTEKLIERKLYINDRSMIN